MKKTKTMKAWALMETQETIIEGAQEWRQLEIFASWKAAKEQIICFQHLNEPPPTIRPIIITFND